mmetsp:Transcript_46065/g.100051  ORF Transcript_46065/g.100051 Transcript_46065/m.100051 type:complete len:203 (-) Transcript_46065:77-685(-)
MQYDYLVKVLLIGDSGVGKSSLLLKFAEDRFVQDAMMQTIGIDFRVKMLQRSGQRVKLQIWDTAGQERFATITQQYYRSAHGIILVFDVTSEESFANIRRWVSQIAAHGSEATNRLLLGNKADYEPPRRVIDSARGQALAAEYGIPYLETSAKIGLNVEEAFVSMVDSVMQRLHGEAPQDREGFRLTPQVAVQQRQGCCREG